MHRSLILVAGQIANLARFTSRFARHTRHGPLGIRRSSLWGQSVKYRLRQLSRPRPGCIGHSLYLRGKCVRVVDDVVEDGLASFDQNLCVGAEHYFRSTSRAFSSLGGHRSYAGSCLIDDRASACATVACHGCSAGGSRGGGCCSLRLLRGEDTCGLRSKAFAAAHRLVPDFRLDGRRHA